MQENNFEKQVQQKMEEFRVTPASEVWQKVELEIIRKKKNWRVLFIMAFITLLLGTAGVGWWSFSFTPSTNKLSTTNQSQGQFQNTLTDNVKKISENNQNTKSESDKTDDLSKRKGNKQSTINFSNKIYKQEQQLAGQSIKARDVEIDKAFKENQVTVKENEYKPIKKISGRTQAITATSIKNVEIEDAAGNSVKIAQNQQAEPTIYLSKIDGTGILLNSLNKQNTQSFIVKNDSAIVQLKVDLQTLKEQQLIVSRNKAKAEGIKLNKWQFGLNLSLGISSTRNSYLGITSIGEEKLFADPSQVNSGTGGTANPGVTPKPSTIKIGKAFIIGAFARRSLSPRVSFLVGVDYKFYSTNMFIGSRFDSAVTFSTFEAYYRTGSSVRYNNHFHFIEIPINLRWKISKQSKLPLYVDAGITITQLVNTNALQYRTATGYYYKDNSFFKKTSVNISSKLLIDLSKENKQRFLLGPEINFSLGSMSNTGLYQNKHYSYLGISLQKSIGKK